MDHHEAPAPAPQNEREDNDPSALAQLDRRVAALEHAMTELGKFLDTVIIMRRI